MPLPRVVKRHFLEQLNDLLGEAARCARILHGAKVDELVTQEA